MSDRAKVVDLDDVYRYADIKEDAFIEDIHDDLKATRLERDKAVMFLKAYQKDCRCAFDCPDWHKQVDAFLTELDGTPQDGGGV